MHNNNKDYGIYKRVARNDTKQDKIGYKVVERILNSMVFKSILKYNELRGLDQ